MLRLHATSALRCALQACYHLLAVVVLVCMGAGLLLQRAVRRLPATPSRQRAIARKAHTPQHATYHIHLHVGPSNDRANGGG